MGGVDHQQSGMFSYISAECQHRSESTSTHRSKNASVEGAMVWASGFLTRGCARGNRPLAAAKNLTS
jgi:hypothetical protein